MTILYITFIHKLWSCTSQLLFRQDFQELPNFWLLNFSALQGIFALQGGPHKAGLQRDIECYWFDAATNTESEVGEID